MEINKQLMEENSEIPKSADVEKQQNSDFEKNNEIIEPNQQLLSIATSVESLAINLNEFKKELIQKMEDHTSKDEAIQRMSKQIELYELGLMRKVKEGLIKDIIGFYDAIDDFQKNYQRLDDREKLEKDIQFLKAQVEEILFRNDVNCIENQDNNFYNREMQLVVKKETTDNEKEHNEIVRIFRHGFKLDDRILRKQEVIIKEFMSI